ncbi:DUF3606 domain-containing protein [Pantoea sp. USHLN298]|uniref:DUF3606 domain-containing protein n=1 Tax=Pantoea sp. USHLN298 TaxID=3081294 RepID=UPI003017349F
MTILFKCQISGLSFTCNPALSGAAHCVSKSSFFSFLECFISDARNFPVIFNLADSGIIPLSRVPLIRQDSPFSLRIIFRPATLKKQEEKKQMKNPIQRRSPEDLSRVELREQWQITYWTQELKTTQERLTRAIRETGPEADHVRDWLEKNPPPRRPAQSATGSKG